MTRTEHGSGTGPIQRIRITPFHLALHPWPTKAVYLEARLEGKLVKAPPRSQRTPRELYLSQRELLGYPRKGARSISRIIHRIMEKPPDTPQREGDKLRSNRPTIVTLGKTTPSPTHPVSCVRSWPGERHVKLRDVV